MSSPRKSKFHLPPPPPRMAKSSQKPANKTTPPAPPSLEPHSSTADIPVLHSAPPSANNHVSSSNYPVASLPQQQQQYQQQPQYQQQVPPAVVQPTVVALPPPPPPPPPRGASSTTTTTTTSFAADPNASAMASPAAVLTPPPNVPPVTTTQTTPATTPTPQPPPQPLPPTAFLSSTPQLLAQRQTHHPILLVATEAAHVMAHKNELQLHDLMEGLLQSMLGAFAASSSSTSFATSTTTSNSGTPYIPPFRSVTQSLHWTWKDVHVTFSNSNNITEDGPAAEFLPTQAALQPQDGPLEQELFILQDQVDNLLQETTTTSSNNNTTTIDHYSQWEERQRQLEQVNKDAFSLTSPGTIPWLWRYRQALDLSTDQSTHELFHCPALALIVATTHEPNVVQTIQALVQSKYYLPQEFQTGLFDPHALSYAVLVLHDNCSTSTTDPEHVLPSLRQQFGPHVEVLRVNSIPLATAHRLAEEETKDLWGGHGQKGNCLSINDRVALRKYLANLITHSLLPALERRIAKLNAIVSERKKGVRNVLKSFWRTGKKDEDPHHNAGNSSGGGADGSTVPYRYDSIENQTRLLADTLFLVKDYDNALATYRLIRDDFKQDKAHAEYGSVQEMMALCLHEMDPYHRAREIFSHWETALLSYNRAAIDQRSSSSSSSGRITVAPLATRCATRLCLVLTAATSICDGRHLEVADLLASASSNETALGAAVLLEQGSAHYFHAALYRKYAFHMLMSGHMFRTAEQHPHAFRCFTSALYIYRHGQWEELHNHLRSALAAQLFTMGRMAIALQLYAKLVGSTEGGRVSVKSQQKFVNHLLEICSDHYKKALAGADRMAAPAYLSGAERDKVRKEKLDRIVQVVRYTKSAVRVLELANVDLPAIDDSTVVVLAEEAAHRRQESVENFGQAKRGSDDLWEELMLATVAELKASDEARAQVDDEVMISALTKIENSEIRKVIAEMDKEKLSRSLKERAKRSASYKEKPPVRAQMEPFFVEFTMRNPLGIPVDLVDLQLVAKMTDANGERMCTNEDAVTITPLVSYNEKPKWNFHSTEEDFLVAHFCRVSAGKQRDKKEKWKAGEEETPFFVVTKTKVTLDAECRKTVFLGICPLERGDLEILGVRFRLFDDVWLYHPFRIKGPLLQNTRANRANRIRGESMLLKATIERGMPCLAAEILATQEQTGSTGSGPTLQGQIRKWILRVTNIGTAPASNAVMKTNVPWIRIPEDPSSEQRNKAVSKCIGPSGTLMSIPIHGSNLKENGKLEPGDSLDIPIEIRTSGAGKQDFYMLFRYEIPDESSSSNSPRFRWLKKMFEVPVYPSLTLSAALLPSSLHQGEHILSVELTNNRSDRPDNLKLLLEKVSLASWHYSLKPIPGQLAVSPNECAELGWQDRISAHYRVVPKDPGAEPPLISECDFSGSSGPSVDDNHDSLLAFLCLERAHEEFEENFAAHKVTLARAAAAHDTERQHPRSIAQIRRANTGASGSTEDGNLEAIDTGHSTSVTRLCPKSDDNENIHIICTWKGGHSTLKGEHHIRGLFVRPRDKTRGCPIVLSASHPSSLLNDFSQGPASVPFSITLRNKLAKAPVAFEFTLDKSDAFDITGTECFSSELAGGDELTLPMQALITSCGVYNLQRVRLKIIKEEVVSYIFPLQWLVTITGC